MHRPQSVAKGGKKVERGHRQPQEKGIEPLYVSSSKEIDELIRDILPAFEGRETESNWFLRDRHIHTLRRLTYGNAPTDFTTSYANTMKYLLDDIFKVANSLRTTLCTTACTLLQEIVRAIGPRADSWIDLLLNNLLKLCGSLKKLTSNTANETVTVAIQHVSYSTRLMSHILAAAVDKNVQLRLFAAGWMKEIIQKQADKPSTLESGNVLNELHNVITKGIADSNPSVRETMRKVFWAFAENWPDRALKTLNGLDAKSKSLLEKDNSNPNRNKAAPLAPKRSQPSSNSQDPKPRPMSASSHRNRVPTPAPEKPRPLSASSNHRNKVPAPAPEKPRDVSHGSEPKHKPLLAKPARTHPTAPAVKGNSHNIRVATTSRNHAADVSSTRHVAGPPSRPTKTSSIDDHDTVRAPHAPTSSLSSAPVRFNRQRAAHPVSPKVAADRHTERHRRSPKSSTDESKRHLDSASPRLVVKKRPRNERPDPGLSIPKRPSPLEMEQEAQSMGSPEHVSPSPRTPKETHFSVHEDAYKRESPLHVDKHLASTKSPTRSPMSPHMAAVIRSASTSKRPPINVDMDDNMSTTTSVIDDPLELPSPVLLKSPNSVEAEKEAGKNEMAATNGYDSTPEHHDSIDERLSLPTPVLAQVAEEGPPLDARDHLATEHPVDSAVADHAPADASVDPAATDHAAETLSNVKEDVLSQPTHVADQVTEDAPDKRGEDVDYSPQPTHAVDQETENALHEQNESVDYPAQATHAVDHATESVLHKKNESVDYSSRQTHAVDHATESILHKKSESVDSTAGSSTNTEAMRPNESKAPNASGDGMTQGHRSAAARGPFTPKFDNPKQLNNFLSKGIDVIRRRAIGYVGYRHINSCIVSWHRDSIEEHVYDALLVAILEELERPTESPMISKPSHDRRTQAMMTLRSMLCHGPPRIKHFYPRSIQTITKASRNYDPKDRLSCGMLKLGLEISDLSDDPEQNINALLDIMVTEPRQVDDERSVHVGLLLLDRQFERFDKLAREPSSNLIVQVGQLIGEGLESKDTKIRQAALGLCLRVFRMVGENEEALFRAVGGGVHENLITYYIHRKA